MGHASLPLVLGIRNIVKIFGRARWSGVAISGEIAAPSSYRFLFARRDLLPPLQSAAYIEGEKAEGLSATIF